MNQESISKLQGIINELSQEATQRVQRKICLLKERIQAQKEIEQAKKISKVISELKPWIDDEQPQTIKFNVGGKFFETTRDTVLKENSLLKAMAVESVPVEKDSSGAIKINRDPKHFGVVLNYLRANKEEKDDLIFTENLQELCELYYDAMYYCIPELTNKVFNFIEKKNIYTAINLQKQITDNKDEKQSEKQYMSNTLEELKQRVQELIQDKSQEDIVTEILKLKQKKKYVEKSCKTEVNRTCIFNVGGKRFKLSLFKIAEHQDSKLFEMALNEGNEVFIDRSPELFKFIHEFMENGMISQCLSFQVRKKLIYEAKYYKLGKLERYLDFLKYPLDAIGKENKNMKEIEDYLRKLYATDRNNPIISKNPYVLLVSLLDNLHMLKTQDPEPFIPLLYDFTNPKYKNPPKHIHFKNIIQDSERFKTNFRCFTWSMFEGLEWKNVFVAGGSVLACLYEFPSDKISPLRLQSKSRADKYTTLCKNLQSSGKWTTSEIKLASQMAAKYPYRKSDIDIFLYGLTEQEAEKKVEEICDTIKRNLQKSTGSWISLSFIRTNSTITIAPSFSFLRTVQIITRIYKNPAEILMGFDLDCCTVGYDGYKVWGLPRAIRAISKRYNLVDIDRQSLTYEYRLAKYARRGFRVGVPGFYPELVKLECLVQYPKTGWFDVSYYKMHGLAKLLKDELNYINKKKRGVLCSDSRINDYFHLSGSLNNHSPFVTEDLKQILNYNGSDKSIPKKIKWITIDPGRQFIGSFHPLNKNFYEDAYSTYDEFVDRLRKNTDVEYVITWWRKKDNGSWCEIEWKDTSKIEEEYKKKVRFFTLNNYEYDFEKMIMKNNYHTIPIRRAWRESDY